MFFTRYQELSSFDALEQIFSSATILLKKPKGKNTDEERFEVCAVSSKNRLNANAARVENFTLSFADSFYNCFDQKQMNNWRKADLSAIFSINSPKIERKFLTTRCWQCPLVVLVNLKLIKRKQKKHRAKIR